MRSPLPAVMRLPSPDHAHFSKCFSTVCWWPDTTCAQRLAGAKGRTSQTRRVLSMLLVSRKLPFGCSAMPVTQSPWPRSSRRTCCMRKSHTCTAEALSRRALMCRHTHTAASTVTGSECN